MIFRPREPTTFRGRIGRRSPPRDTVETPILSENLCKANKKPMSIKTADVIASAITKRLLVVVTEATYVAVAGVSGSL
jgi:hypothetical protein